MLVKYKPNKRYACYNSDCLTSVGRIETTPRPHGPFKGCGDCSYAQSYHHERGSISRGKNDPRQSLQMMERPLMTADELPSRARAVYMYLKDRSGKSQDCWPVVKTIASDLELSRSTVKRALNDLTKAGLVEKKLAIVTTAVISVTGLF